TIIATDISDNAPALFHADKSYILPHGDRPEFFDALIQLLLKEKIDLLIPSIDPDLERLSLIRNEILAVCPKLTILIPPERTISIANNKRLSSEVFKELSANVPQTIDPEDANLNFPLFMKPVNGSASEGIAKIEDQLDLDYFYRKNPQAIFEEFIDGTEYTVDILCDFDGHAHIAIPRKRIKVRGGEVLQGMIERNDQLETLAKKLAEGCDCTGPVTLQFIKQGRDYYAMELNARMGGGLPLTIAAGADWPKWIIAFVNKEDPAIEQATINDQLAMTRYDQSVFIDSKNTIDISSFQKVKTIICDLDDTIYLERNFVFNGYKSAAQWIEERYGLDAGKIFNSLKTAFYDGIRNDIFGYVLRHHHLELDEEEIKSVVEVYRNNQGSLEVFDDFEELLNLQKQGYELAVITDGWHAVQLNKVKLLGLDAVISTIIYSDAIIGRKSWKPSKIPYRICLDILGENPDQAVYIGDNPTKDFYAAKKMGIRTIRIQREDTEHSEKIAESPAHAAEYKISSFSELGNILKEKP
ncbi:MAG: ATP-grasp domain-containing protein, partial [Lentisphaeria bacterium]|nr:ATP-grasp domain-containing protein [Lentisphaeria bacterium]NQZ69510.1 ATP-grasp domain-containing protein [Lentisphaeria bacterium]